MVEERTALANRLLREVGVFLPQGINQLRAHFIAGVQDGNSELQGPAREALMRGRAQWQTLDQQIAWLDRQTCEHASHDARVTPCMEICGVGPLTASAMVTSIVDARQFRNARQMAV
jgi:transposase